MLRNLLPKECESHTLHDINESKCRDGMSLANDDWLTTDTPREFPPIWQKAILLRLCLLIFSTMLCNRSASHCH